MLDQETRFLIIDDSFSTRRFIRKALNGWGYTRIDEAEDGQQGFHLLQRAQNSKTPYGCIICDLNMPQLNGLELLELRNSNSQIYDIPFILMTLESKKEHILQAAQMGVTDFLKKPFSEARLQEKLMLLAENKKPKA